MKLIMRGTGVGSDVASLCPKGHIFFVFFAS